MLQLSRVSTSYEEQKNSLEFQKKYYEDLIAGNPQWIFSGIYADNVSGRCNRKMPQFQCMILSC